MFGDNTDIQKYLYLHIRNLMSIVITAVHYMVSQKYLMRKEIMLMRVSVEKLLSQGFLM